MAVLSFSCFLFRYFNFLGVILSIVTSKLNTVSTNLSVYRQWKHNSSYITILYMQIHT